MNSESLEQIISDYKKDFSRISSEEVYKWEAIQWFQERWDINAENFTEMLTNSFAKADNLLTARNYFPKGMLIEFSNKDSEAVRAMFLDLFDESKEVVERVDTFIRTSQNLLEKYGEESWKQHYQTANSISTYLFFRYPDSYYLYKPQKFKKMAVKIEFPELPKRGRTESIKAYFSMCEEIRSAIMKDEELCKMSQQRLGDKHYPDNAFHILTDDIIYFGSRYEPENSEWWPGETSYHPDITTEQWLDLLHNKKVFTNDSLTIMKRLLDNGGQATCTELSQKYGESKGFYNIGSSSLAKRVHKETNCPLLTKDDDSNSKWWPVLYVGKNATKNEVGSYIWRLRPELKEALEKTDLSQIPLYTQKETEDSTRQYWWLNANPKTWSFSSLRIGEEQNFTLYNITGNKRKIFQNFLDANADDYVIGYESTPVKQVVALGRIVQENDGEHLPVEKLESLSEPIDYSTLKGIKELEGMEYFQNPNGTLFKLTKEEYDVIMDIIREQNPLPQAKEELPAYTKEDFLDQVYLDEIHYDTLMSLLKHKKNIILQGAPGVGKTYTAKRLAYALIGTEDEERIEFIQFHQNYSYEDFIMGYKPHGDGFDLRYGVFYQFCKKAESNPDDKYVFIIDEINRGNLSKIFGELLMLIEKEYRGTKVTMAYNGLPFSVPANLYIIGMMNTADRSLAMIDYALRRRFSFFDMAPAFDSEGFKKYQTGLDNEMLDEVIAEIKMLNQDIASDPSLGAGFCIGHSYFSGQTNCTEEWLSEVIEYDILPMLREYWFDEVEKVRKWESRLRGVLHD
ncbi:restriction endonuclease [Pradoshia eiseniae]|uniref:Restriction endonuclease n=1 Tax=Pradoshia eiseniae TaxID=2064768 RepID=A0A2S7MXB7_9BACI|nr:AAA family ATPase [Pradoshia eiseniae]PQD94403.1 restriction endonuclease [Pradoshia eiseniae]